MNFTYLFLFVFALFSLISAIIEFRLMPNETNKNWKKIVSILTMVMALLVLLFTLYNLVMASPSGAALVDKIRGRSLVADASAGAVQGAAEVSGSGTA
jgi:hypothetical protein